MNRITTVEVQKRNKKRVNVFVDDEFAFACDAELIYKYNIKKDEFIDLEGIKNIIEEENFIQCRNSALKIVERSYKTEKEIVEKLLVKGYDKKSIERAIDFLKEYNFINDKMYAEHYVNDKIKQQGKNKIYYTLIKKGISQDYLKEKLDKVQTSTEREIALELCRKKYEILSKRETDKYKISQKLFRFLAAKGYDFDLINEIVKKIINLDNYLE
ncbi:hypothetical protein CPJCM30710_13250 [Clostridium polyendosporum]|uniref:Regulatory protein RecX n=1 Tax=Clostridium polyendosporum TaxID=69208 RepID=A0A919RYL2_9CLOT|nr:recombination regulator RecX [Clostridium polyendosporum]GIM28659.1 hypothetical protein CPJCM30710_13250 [Clostridium polyendosporum]